MSGGHECHHPVKGTGPIRLESTNTAVTAGGRRQFNHRALSKPIGDARPGDGLCGIRLGCSLRELLETGVNLRVCDIDLVSTEERIDTTSAAGGLVFHVLGVITKFKRRPVSASRATTRVYMVDRYKTLPTLTGVVWNGPGRVP